MSAREELKSYLISALNQETIYPHEAEEASEKLIDGLLHEEAEKIRDMERRNAWPERNGYAGSVTVTQVADFLDPYAK